MYKICFFDLMIMGCSSRVTEGRQMVRAPRQVGWLDECGDNRVWNFSFGCFNFHHKMDAL